MSAMPKNLQISRNMKVQIMQHCKGIKLSTLAKSLSSELNEKASLKNHQAAHATEKPYQCNECDKSYKKREDLVVHQR